MPTPTVKPPVHGKNVEVNIVQENGKAVIQGKTSVPFKMFVSLILQRKVQMLFKDNQNDPVIVGSDLLTKLASTPEDKMEDRGKLVAVTFGIGILAGVFVSAAVLLILQLFSVQLGTMELSLILAVLGGTALVGGLIGRMQGPSTKQKLYERMEGISNTLSRF